MRKVVKVNELIKTAKFVMEQANVYLRDGDIKNYNDALKRVDGMVSLISIVAIKDIEDWDKEWDKIYDMIHE